MTPSAESWTLLTSAYRVALTAQFKERLGTLFTERRRDLALTQADVAERTGLSVKYYGEIERGEANATLDALAAIAFVLDWDPWTLFSRDAPPMAKSMQGLVRHHLRNSIVQSQGLLQVVEALDRMPLALARLPERTARSPRRLPSRPNRPPDPVIDIAHFDPGGPLTTSRETATGEIPPSPEKPEGHEPTPSEKPDKPTQT